MSTKTFTTVKQAEDTVAYFRKQLTQDIKNGDVARYLSSRLNQLAEAEGVLTVARIVDSNEHAEESVLGLLLNGADDGWSGRNNDVRRAYFDGVREAASRFLRGS